MKPYSVNGRKACIFADASGEVMVRFYKPNFEFEDFKLKHSDLEVIINDSDAFVYPKTEVLDHSPATLGIDEESIC